MQLNIYAKFTEQGTIERSNTFAQAVRAGELYDLYYSGVNSEFTYIIAGVAIVGPLLLVITIVVLHTLDIVSKFRIDSFEHKT